MTIETDKYGRLKYQGDTFNIITTRYSDPERLNLARNAALYLGKTDIDNVRRPLNILRDGHVGEVFRGEYVEFIFNDVSKEVYDHLITYTTRVMRVTGGNRALVSDDYTMPSDKMKDPEGVRLNIEKSMSAYGALIDSGETKQVSRSAMPVAAKMNAFVFQFNFLTLGESLFKQRIWEKGAQGNTVKVVKAMYELCSHVDKELWDTFYENKGTPAVEWSLVRRRLMKNKYSVKQLVDDFLDSSLDADMPILEYLTAKYGEQKTMW